MTQQNSSNTGINSLGTDPLAGIFGQQPPIPVATPQATDTTLTPSTHMALEHIPESALGKDGRQMVDDALARLPVENLELNTVILLGSDVQKELGLHIDSLLGQVSQKNSPVLFDLFEKLASGIEGANLGELEQKMQAGQNPGLLTSLSERLGWSKTAVRLKRVADDVRDTLAQKSKTLLNLVQGMENKALTEVQRLLGSVNQLDQMSRNYLQSVKRFAVATEIGREILERARAHHLKLIQTANESEDPQHIAAARDFQLLVEQLENRVLTLRMAYEKIPADLEILRTAKGAASTTLAETANGIQQEFNDLKSALLNWHLLLNVQDMQTINDQRRKVTQAIRRHNITVLDKVVTEAAEVQGQNRLQDAKLLLEVANGLQNIRTKVKGIEEMRAEQFKQAEGALSQARQIFISLPASTSSDTRMITDAK